MILHISNINSTISHFINFIDDEFNTQEHYFWLYGPARDPCKAQKSDRVYFCEPRFYGQLKAYLKLFLQLHLAKKVIIHGLFNIRVIAILAFCPWLIRKCYWIIWGGDLYSYRSKKKTWLQKGKEFLKRFVVKRVGHLVTGTPGDVELARAWYGATGKHILCFNYPSNVFVEKPEQATEDDHFNILIGNSADPSNNHIDVFNRLRGGLPENARIYCPLSYGNAGYAREVIVEGKAIFGDKFKPMTDFMAFRKYLEFLSSIDVAIFDHNRQQAFGNALCLIGFGKKVYLNPTSTLNGMFEQFGIEIYDSGDINLNQTDTDALKKNQMLVAENFSKKALVDSLHAWIE
jgi:dTDP-N-acetylfucosamine:lipid II N-acetylfucosaminyltransferase